MRHILSPLIIITLIFIIYTSTRSPTIQLPPPTKITADFTFENVSVSMHQHGRKVWTIHAKESSLFKQSNVFYLSDINGIYSGTGDMSFDSPKGAYHIKRQELKLVKTNLKLTLNDHHYFVICDEIEINAKDNRLSAYGHVLINSDHIILKSRKLVADLTKNALYFTHNINGSIISNTFN